MLVCARRCARVCARKMTKRLAVEQSIRAVCGQSAHASTHTTRVSKSQRAFFDFSFVSAPSYDEAKILCLSGLEGRLGATSLSLEEFDEPRQQ